MWNGRHNTGTDSSVIRPDDSTESTRDQASYAGVSACGNRLRRLTGLLAFQENRRLHLPRPA